MFQDAGMAEGEVSLVLHGRGAGVAALGDVELVAMLLEPLMGAREARRAAGRLLGDGPLHRLGDSGVASLCERSGLTEAAVVRVLGALELGQRAMRPVVQSKTRLGSPSEVVALCSPVMASLPRERMMVLVLDMRQRLLRHALVADGWAEGCPVDPREVFRPALEERGHAVILVHNHPSGDPTPSRQDRELTTRIRDAGRLLNLRLLDHVVVASGGFSALSSEGLCER